MLWFDVAYREGEYPYCSSEPDFLTIKKGTKMETQNPTIKQMNFVYSSNNGVTAVMREKDALKHQTIPGTNLHDPSVPIFTFASEERYLECMGRSVRVYVGTTDHMDAWLASMGQHTLVRIDRWRFSGVGEWKGFVPFSNNVKNISCDDSDWLRELSYRATAADVIEVFFNGDIERYYTEFFRK